MKKEVLNEREFELVNIIGAKIGANQRDLSRRLELSLGMTNMLIRRLISKGYIRIRQLNPRKVEYILTPKGFSEKLRKSVKYTIKTVQSIGLIKEKVKGIIKKIYDEGERNFIVLGKSDFALLIEMSFRDLNYPHDYKISYVEELSPGITNGTILICTEDDVEVSGLKTINLTQELAKDQALATHTAGEMI